MAWRVLMDANGLKVSRPGISVLSADAKDLYFDSRWAQMEKLFSGAVSLGKSENKTVLFPKSYSRPPVFVTYWNSIQQFYLFGTGIIIFNDRFVIYNQADASRVFYYSAWDYMP